MRSVGVVLAALVALLVAGCGGGEEPEPTPTPTATGMGPVSTPMASPGSSVAATPLPGRTPTPQGRLPMTKVAFMSRRDGRGEIYVLQPDGSQVNVSNDPAEDQNPDWSPDGSKLAFSSNRTGEFALYLVNADGSELTRLSDGPGDENPRWSPDGKRIAFSRVGTLMVMDADGGNVRRIMGGRGAGDGGSLCETGGFAGGWSPDGTQVIFYAADPVRRIGDLCIVNLDGSGLRTVASEPDPLDDDGDGRINEDDVDGMDDDQDTQIDEDAPMYYVEPSWSADGQRITYRSIRGANYEVNVVNADGSGDVNLTGYPGMDIEPDWSPDGQWIVFASDRDGDFLELYAMRADGSDVLRLTNSPGKDSEPSWSPR